jgi:ABC-type uncharacterized transport system substrate-binding protein
MSYGPNIEAAWRDVGVYAGRVLKGTNPRELPVEQVSKFELIINAQTARMGQGDPLGQHQAGVSEAHVQGAEIP